MISNYMAKVANKETKLSELNLSNEEILYDYRVAYLSREASYLGRKEVLTGKAKFGIFGDGKEIAQVAMARSFQKGDIRSGYYRDQTFMFHLEMSNIQEFFAQLYADTNLENEPCSAGRSMNGHFGTRSLNEDGTWKNLTEMYNSSADISPTGSQMPRLVGLAYASKLYRQLPELANQTNFSRSGNEIAYGTIGNASTAEGMFWEAINAGGVLGAPLLMSIWDDGYGISVPNKYQVTKEDLSAILSGFQRDPGTTAGYDLYTVKAWNYPELIKTYREAAKKVREEHVPAIIHVTEVTQPQGHSTSGSHERYKSPERLQWEQDADAIRWMRNWIIENGIATEEELTAMEKAGKKEVKNLQKAAWANYTTPIQQNIKTVTALIEAVAEGSSRKDEVMAIAQGLKDAMDPFFRDIMIAVNRTLITVRNEDIPAVRDLIEWRNAEEAVNHDRWSSFLHEEREGSAMKVEAVPAVYSEDSPELSGFEVLNAFFDLALERDPRVVAFGEDLGKIGDVNQGFRGLQDKYGELRVSDTGIRECTILGQAIGMSMRGLRPIAEIQYLDYLLYALQIMSDDLATLQYRTKGGQKAPAIIRTRGHRLEGIWHSGSPMGGVIHLLRGIHVCVPRNMTQAAGFYNTLLKSEEPGLIVEVLNGYRLKERKPDNLADFTVPLGVPEVLREGTDITLVTYGANCRIAEEAADLLAQCDISMEIIDVQTLLPFDVNGKIVESLKKTNRIVFLDEDVPGGSTSYMMQQVLEKQKGYFWLDSEPITISAKPHRPAYGSDGDYWSKPHAEGIFETVYELMNEADPVRYPLFFK